jgi:long-chain acyl-CoA synthetase
MLVADSGYTQVRLHGLGDVLCEQSRSRPGHLAVIDGTVRLTYRDLDLRVDQLAQVLRDRGAGPGSRILWVGQNSHRLLEAILAGARLGAVTCPVNWRMSPEEAAFALQDFDPAIVLWEDGEVGPLSRKMLQSTAAANRAWIRHDGDGSVDYEALLQAAKAIRVDESVNPDSAVLAIYTAASVRPRRCCHTRRCCCRAGSASRASRSTKAARISRQGRCSTSAC